MIEVKNMVRMLLVVCQCMACGACNLIAFESVVPVRDGLALSGQQMRSSGVRLGIWKSSLAMTSFFIFARLIMF